MAEFPVAGEEAEAQPTVTTCGEVGSGPLTRLLERYGLTLRWADPRADIPGSYWGAPEAGLIGTEVWVRHDTPIHSLLHEAGHTLCMDPARRQQLHTDAGGDDLPDGHTEESGVCYLQIILADAIPSVGRDRLMRDMDAWGYSFRLGSTRTWFEEDAHDARDWLVRHGLLDGQGRPTWRMRSVS